MFQKLGDALRRFMYGRYGADSLNKWLLIFAVILILLGSLGSRYLARQSESGQVGKLTFQSSPRADGWSRSSSRTAGR